MDDYHCKGREAGNGIDNKDYTIYVGTCMGLTHPASHLAHTIVMVRKTAKLA